MAVRSGIYIVPTDHWYIERAVWLIAGFMLIASTALAALYHPIFAVFVTCTGVASIAVAFTGYCLVGNVLHRLGLPHLMGTADSVPGRPYFMRTDSWYLERRIYVTVGVNITIASILAMVHSPWWLAFTGFVGVAMIWFAGTGFCILANVLYWIGAEPRLAPEKPAARPSLA
jgi:hypothetical protein